MAKVRKNATRPKRQRQAVKRKPMRRARHADPAALREARAALLTSLCRLATTMIERYLGPIEPGSGDYFASSRKRAEVEELERLYKK